MATPTLRALRTLWPTPHTHLAAMLPAPLMPIFQPCPHLDELLPISKRGVRAWRDTLATLRRGRFDAAVLLPNSFRWAALAAAARIPCRIGYARDGRGPLLTHRVTPPHTGRPPLRRFTPVPTREYYLDLARTLGCTQPHATLELHISDEQEARAAAVLRRAGIAGAERFVLLNVGAVRPEKRWPPERFAAVAHRLYESHGLCAAATGSPAERPLTAAVAHAAQSLGHPPVADLAAAGIDLGALKAVCRRAALVITNDTGTRHVAAALGGPLVTLFGPTLPQWTTLDHPLERELAVPDAGPMDRLSVDEVTRAAVETLHRASLRGRL